MRKGHKKSGQEIIMTDRNMHRVMLVKGKLGAEKLEDEIHMIRATANPKSWNWKLKLKVGIEYRNWK